MGDFFRDKHGRLILYQFPNPPLIAWAVSAVLSRVLSGTPGDVADLVAFGSIFTWAWLELFDGVTGFRRLLGLIVLVGSVVLEVRSL